MAGLSPNVKHDESLLRTGDESDVLVRCGDQSWQLHKVILSSRCLYFKTGLKTSWLLGNPLYYYIDEQDVQAVWWIVIWIYVGCLPSELLAEDGSQFTSCLRLIRCSRAFLLPDLTAHAERKLHEVSQKMMIDAQTAFYEAEDSDEQFAVSLELTNFFEGVQKVYEEADLESEKQYFLGVVQHAHFWPLLDRTFEEKAREHTTFWADLMSLQQQSIADGAYWPYWKPEEYCKCHGSPWMSQDPPQSTHWATLKLVKGKCQATCNRCASEARKVWSELWKGEDEEDRKLPPVAEEEEDEEEEGPSSSSAGDAEDDGLMSARKEGEEKERKKLEWLLKVGGTAIPSETRMALWKKVDEMRQAAQG
ncbi:hypothetical protein PG984_013504 [Apiospora sp. TS-2023a]